jgi:hypothetical protein
LLQCLFEEEGRKKKEKEEEKKGSPVTSWPRLT